MPSRLRTLEGGDFRAEGEEFRAQDLGLRGLCLTLSFERGALRLRVGGQGVEGSLGGA